MPPTPISSTQPAQSDDTLGTHACGTLRYTRRHLGILFFWLLWGDFCYVLMESVTGPIMQLKFKTLGASNFEMGLLLGTVPATLGAFLNPIISFKSDRFRSRWGRRIPFLMATLPFLAICLVLLGYGDRVGAWIHDLLGTDVSLAKVTIYTFAGLLVLFTFFNTFVNSVFWYLFNDVVPEPLLARFMSWFRIISMGAAALYSYFIFPHSETHVPEIMIGAAVLYSVGFICMCFNVKEGEYPPPPEYVQGEVGPLAAVKTYATECHSLPHYWFMWAQTFISSMSWGIGMYCLFMSQKIGLNLQQIGNIAGTTAIVTGVLILGSGWLADRYHPIRVVLAGYFINIIILIPASMIWIFWAPGSNEIAYWVSMAIAIAIAAPVAALNGIADPPLLMRFFPRNRYGQFCSTNNLWRTMGVVIGTPLAGLFIDLMVRQVGEAKAYFYIPIWQLCFAIPGCLLMILVFRSWKRYGGDEYYIPPICEPPPDLEVLRASKVNRLEK